ncbi:hypothetical protein J2Z21_000354 [Streptomyces griseochromogenes]|nr:hypothetical protein [Streptomyces griseochromogenes]MBP2047432.1 hypothetical protein [Streptomyces griseochromogenes]
MTDGTQQHGQSANGGGSHGDGVWRYAVAPIVVSAITGLIYQVHGCSPGTPDPAPTSTVTETMGADTPSPSPTVSARITRIVSKGTNSASSSYEDIAVHMDIVGLRGQECLVKWASYYPDKQGGGTGTGYDGKSSTGLLPYDDTLDTTVLAVHKAQYAGWMVHVFVYGPDGTLLAEKDGPTG